MSVQPIRSIFSSTAINPPLIKYNMVALKKQNPCSKLYKFSDLFTRKHDLHTKNLRNRARSRVGGAPILNDSSLYIHSSYVAHVELM